MRALAIVVAMLLSTAVVANIGEINVNVTSKENGIPLKNISVQLLLNNALVRKDMTDSSGVCVFGELAPGKYTIVCSGKNYQTITLKNVEASNEKATNVDVALRKK